MRLPIVFANFKVKKPRGVSSRFRPWILWISLVLIGLVIGLLRTPPRDVANTVPPVASASNESGPGVPAHPGGAGDLGPASGPAPDADPAAAAEDPTAALPPEASPDVNKVALISYVVQPGDTLSSIAGQYNTTADSIAYINGLPSPDRISVGKEISVMTNASGVVVKVASGDTLWDIADRYGTDVDTIASANNLASSKDIQVGQVLLLPGVSPISRPAQVLSRSSSFMWPLGGSITDGYGWRIHPVTGEEQFHEGIDIAASAGTEIRAAASGTVTFAGWSGGYGRLVIISHASGLETRYGHLSGFEAGTGDWVSVGQVIGYVGSSGDATGPHCHFEVRKGGAPLDPRDYLP